MAPGSTATPQQANIIEQLVNATGASKQALEEAAEKAKSVEPLSSAADKQTEALKDRLREVIREKHDMAVRAREAEERVVALEGALRAAGVAVP
jgi:methyl-accepting chemotaxis protein